ncbi:MAG: PIN domain-containing protein [Alphaproteobacteria bacterium]|nr:PIN domain-containing protein [Alphaproteobacteria bacterium]
MILIDTNIAIDLRDGSAVANARVAALMQRPVLSQITRIELEAGVFRQPELAGARRRVLDVLVERFPVIALIDDDVLAYGRIIAACGFDRRKMLDRLIAAQAIARNATLATANAVDFADIPNLKLIAW